MPGGRDAVRRGRHLCVEAVMAEPVRIEFEFPPEWLERLKRLQSTIGAGDLAKVIAHSIIVFDWVIKTQAQGMNVAVVKDGEVVKIVEFVS